MTSEERRELIEMLGTAKGELIRTIRRAEQYQAPAQWIQKLETTTGRVEYLQNDLALRRVKQ